MLVVQVLGELMIKSGLEKTDSRTLVGGMVLCEANQWVEDLSEMSGRVVGW